MTDITMFISLFISLFCILLFILMFSASILVNKAVYKSCLNVNVLSVCSSVNYLGTVDASDIPTCQYHEYLIRIKNLIRIKKST